MPKTVTDSKWVVYELSEDGTATGGYYPASSRLDAETDCDEMNDEAGFIKYGVFLRQVSVTNV